MPEAEYETVGRFIYAAHRVAASDDAVTNWMADRLGVARAGAGDAARSGEIVAAFFARFNSVDALKVQLAEFTAAQKGGTA